MSKKSHAFRPCIEELEARNMPHGGPALLPLSDLVNVVHHVDFAGRFGRTIEDHSLADIPVRHSMESGARATIFLDFDGHTEGAFDPNGDGIFDVDHSETPIVTTPVFDWDHNPTTFSDDELRIIDEVYQRVAEDFIIFNIDVTTEDPGPDAFATGRVLRVAIGGNDDWYQALLAPEDRVPATGVSFISSFTNAAPNVVYAFADNIASAAELAETASHESGHAFGLEHQSVWKRLDSDLFILMDEYNPGTAERAPIMGLSDGDRSLRTTWYLGPTPYSSTDCDDWGALEIFDWDTERCPIYQNDCEVIANGINGIFYRDDVVGDGTASAASLGAIPAGTSVHLEGIVNWNWDKDFYSFQLPAAGDVRIDVDANRLGPNLDVVVELYDARGVPLATWNDADLNVHGHMVLPPGTYYVAVTGAGDYGDCGQYTFGISTLAPPRPATAPTPAPGGGDSTGRGMGMLGASRDTAGFVVTNSQGLSGYKGGSVGEQGAIVTLSNIPILPKGLADQIGIGRIGKDAKVSASGLLKGLTVSLMGSPNSMLDVM